MTQFSATTPGEQAPIVEYPREPIGEDWHKSEHKVAALGAVAAWAATLPVNALHLPTVVALPLAVKIEEKTGIPPAAALAPAILSGAWTYSVARINNSVTEHWPRTVQRTLTKVPKLKALAETAELPGLDPKEELKLHTRLSQGLATYTIGVLPYTVGSVLQEQTPVEREKLCKNLGLDGAAFMGGTALTATTALWCAPGVGETVMHLAENKKILAGILALIVAGKPLAKLVKDKLRPDSLAGRARAMAAYAGRYMYSWSGEGVK